MRESKEAWVWSGRFYRWYLDPSIIYLGNNRYRLKGRFVSRNQAKQAILASIAVTALFELPHGGNVERMPGSKNPSDALVEVSNNTRGREQIEQEFSVLSFHSEVVPELLSGEPLEDLFRLGEWESLQLEQPWYRWGGSRFLISYYVILDRYVSKGLQYRGKVYETALLPIAREAYTTISGRLDGIDLTESDVHTVGMFLAFVARETPTPASRIR